jgi:hypothetical protein
MTNKTYIVMVIVAILLIVTGAYFYLFQTKPAIIGGDRDDHGCLIAAGYAFDEEVGACIRAFEMTSDIKQAAHLAVDKVGLGYALTVVSFNSHEEIGSYDITLERGLEREKKTVYIRSGEVRGPHPIKLYYYNEERDRDSSGNIECSRAGLVAVDREIAPTLTLIEDTIRLLLRGELTEQDKASGISTEYPLLDFSLASSTLANGMLTLTFDDPGNRSVGGACRVGILWFQIEATAKQFPEVGNVRFLPEEIFQP